MELKIANPEASNLAHFLGITPERLFELATEFSKHYLYYVSRIEHGFDKDTDENNLLVDIIRLCKTPEEAVFFASCFNATLKGVIEATIKQKLKQTKYN
jgi:hypothetical protein